MLQWNSKCTMLVVFALLIAAAALGSASHDALLNFTW
jgi:hypothetical protein